MHGPKLALIAALVASLALGLLLWGPGGVESGGLAPGLDGSRAQVGGGSGSLDRASGSQAAAARAVASAELPAATAGEALAEALPGWDLVLTGRVLTADGVPIEGATVERLLDRRSSYAQFGEVEGALGAVQGTVTTAADGAFRFALERPAQSALRVQAEGYSGMSQLGCAPGDDVTLVLALAASLHGFLLDAETLAPVEGGIVRVFHGAEGDSQVEAISGPNGAYSAPNLAAGEAGFLVIHPDYAMPRLAEIELAPCESLRRDAELKPGWVLAGRVVDAASNRPIAGAELSNWSFLGINVATDAAGEYRLAGVRTRPGTLQVRAPGYTSAQKEYIGPSEDLYFELEAGAALQGLVVDGEGRAVSGAFVRTVDADPENVGHWQGSSTRTGVDGLFRFDDLSRTQDIQIAVRAPGYGEEHRFLGALGQAETDLGEIVLPAGRTLTGLIEDRTGAPMAGAGVELRRSPGGALDSRLNLWLQFRGTVADARGRFLLVDLAPGTWEASIRAGHRQPILETVTIDGGPGPTEVHWTVPDGGRISGRVSAVGGEPLPGARLSLRTLEAGKRVFPRTVSAGDGSFEFTDLAAGSWSLAVTPTEDQLRSWHRVELPQVATDGPFLEIELPPADAWIEGLVVDAQGLPLPKVLVVRDPGDGALVGGVLSGDDGSFRIRSTSVGRTTLHAYPTLPMGESKDPGSHVIEWTHGRDLVDRSAPAASIEVQAPLGELVLQIGE